jgi:hypothetical protein
VMALSQMAGWLGAGGLLVCYWLVSNERVSPKSVSYQWANIGSAFGLCWAALDRLAWPSFAINAVWIVIAGLAIAQARSRRRHSASTQATQIADDGSDGSFERGDVVVGR